MFISRRRGGTRKPSFHGGKPQAKVTKDDFDLSADEKDDYLEEVTPEAKVEYSIRRSVAARAAFFKAGLIGSGSFRNEARVKRARSDFVLGAIQAMMEYEPESDRFNFLASSARRRLLQDGLPHAKRYIREKGYLMESPPLLRFKGYIDSIEPVYHRMSSAMWTIPSLNLRLIEMATPSAVSGASTEILLNLITATVDVVITGILAPASVFYLSMHCLSTRPERKEEERCD